MSKASTFNAAKYRSNPKAIANYLNDALATGRFRPSARQSRARPRNGGRCRRGRSRRSIQIAPRRHGSSVRHSIEGADRTRHSIGGKACRRLVELGLKGKK